MVLCTQSNLYAQTAAEIDWREAQQPGQCRGHYVQPPGNASSGELIQASAKRAQHIENQATSLTGDVDIQRGGQRLRGDSASIDATTRDYSAEGRVRLRQADLLVTGERIKGNLVEQTAAMDQASFLLHRSRLRGRAERIEKTADDTLVISRGRFTNCEPGGNTWSARGRSIRLFTGKGYGVARDVSLRIKDVPVAYFPYFRFPIDDSRQTGLLLPGAGRDSDGGTDISLPYYLNLAPNYDATYTLRSIWKRGLMHEGEFRFMNHYGRNSIAAAFLPSDDNYDDRDRAAIGAANDAGRQDRWLAHISHRGGKGPWSSRLHYTSVSDRDYFNDLGGFARVDSGFDRALDLRDSPALLRRGLLRYTATHWRGTLELRGFQELDQGRADQYRILPRVSLATMRKFGRARTSGSFQLTQFERASDPETPTGSRAVANIDIKAPFRKAWGFITPGAHVIHRRYRLDDTSPGARKDADVTTTGASLDMGLILERRNNRVLQTLEPRLRYLYRDADFQNDLPLFDSTAITPGFDALFRNATFTGYDRVGDANRFALGVTTTVSGIRTGRQFLAAGIGRMFHLNDGRINRTGADPLFVTVSAQTQRFRVAASYEYDKGDSNRGYLALGYRSPDKAVVNFNYAMTDASLHRYGSAFPGQVRRNAGVDLSPGLPAAGFRAGDDLNPRLRNEEESDLSFSLPLDAIWPGRAGASWQLVGRWNYGWDNNQTIESLFGVEYNNCCWKARILFRRNLDRPRLIAVTTPGSVPGLVVDRRADSGVYFEFQLKGLASLGGRLDALLQNSIPGYLSEEH